MLSRQQGQIIDVKWENHNKSATLIFFSAITELVRELVICNMHDKFRKKYMKNFSSHHAHKVELLT